MILMLRMVVRMMVMMTMMNAKIYPIFDGRLFPATTPTYALPPQPDTHTENYSSKGHLVTVDGQKKYTTFPLDVIDSYSDDGMCPISARNSPPLPLLQC